MRLVLLLLAGCSTIGRWEYVRADHPATRAELALYPLSVPAPAMAPSFEREGFTVVTRPPHKGELRLEQHDGVATLTSDDYFVDQVRSDDVAFVAEALAHSRRVAEFVRNSGTVEQRQIEGM